MSVLFFGLLSLPALAANAPSSPSEVRVGVVLFDGVQIIDFAGPYEVFGNAGFGVVTLSHDGKPVTTAMGLTVTPDASFADAPPFDVLLVPGGDVGDAQKDPQVLSFIREHAAGSRHVLSVCTGAFILAGAGLLDGQQATTFTPRIDELARQFPAVNVIRDVRWADNGRIVTAAGLSSGLDAALHVVARLKGTEKAQSVALHLEYDWKPEGGFVRSRMADRHVPRSLDKAVEWPKDLAMSQEFSLGDEQQWRMRFHVTAGTTADDLLQRIAKGIASLPEWTREPGTNRWTADKEGRRVRLELDTTAGSSASDYRLDLRVATTLP
ncbi:DJ-1/PfpI family protein [Montanilutibacter psychrotolerans]|uniref:DJ-1/PfpI family protein n=1 Tax=Montanilutibacter psychrotolerans TaxID=1327343 RepID=UPI001680B111|nr:DJ-1/PfpI family protein [Lysobacter psychrotolerans]